jgi:hypothetical protein
MKTNLKLTQHKKSAEMNLALVVAVKNIKNVAVHAADKKKALRGFFVLSRKEIYDGKI